MALQDPTLAERAGGVLLHPTSLPSAYGVGDLGPAATEFADFLARAGQRWWQTLPITPPGPGHSPYASPSAFAGNPFLVSPETLVADGLLSSSDLPPRSGGPVDYDALYGSREALFRKAFAKFAPDASFDRFRAEHASWLSDWSLFAALKQERGGSPWWDWDSGLRTRDTAALDAARTRLADEIRYQEFLQYQFDRQWTGLRQSLKARGIGLIGDIPIYVAHDSADVWSNQRLFELDATGRPTRVAGVPPDAFSADGQRWGNPLYRWDELKKTNYDWWTRRFDVTLKRFDAVRLDHFIGFQRYWAIPADASTAKKGQWLPGPGADLFAAVGHKGRIIAEDLGSVTPEVHALRDRFGFPGMRVLQFAFDGTPEADYHLKNHPKNAVVYTGTHDNNTTRGWFDADAPRKRVLAHLGSDGTSIHWDLVAEAHKSPATLAIVPAQDLLGLGADARMNAPGLAKGNWAWRLKPGELTNAIADKLRTITATSGRGGGANDVARGVGREAGGLAQFGLAFLLKEAVKGNNALPELAKPSFWGGALVFTGASRLAGRGTVLPLAAGMAAMQLLAGDFSWSRLLMSTGAFLAAGVAVNLVADGLIYPALFAAGPPGWIAAGAYTVAKLAATLYLGEKIEEWFARARHVPAREGVIQKLPR
jgi:4-alpha-glucanotransferase